MCLVSSIFLCVFRVMATFSVLDDDDYGNIFITQEARSDNVVSLEESSNFKSVLDAKYSDILDFEEDPIDERMRYEMLSCILGL